MGFCKGIENYSRHLSGAKPGEPPPTLIDYLPPDALMFIDESHVTIGQIGGMYKGDRSRKENLVELRLSPALGAGQPAAAFRRIRTQDAQTVFVSATPAEYEKQHVGPGGGAAGAADRPGRSEDRSAPGHAPRWTTCCRRSRARVAEGERVLVTTLTKRMAEDLTEYPGRPRHQGALPALRRRYGGARGDHPRPAPGQVRRAGRHQPAARRPGPARGGAGGHPGRRQGRFPALRALADPNHRPRGAQSRGHRDPVCR